MSLVNDVLRDLDERRRRESDCHFAVPRESGEAGTNVYEPPIRGSRSVRYTCALACAALACAALACAAVGGTALLRFEQVPLQPRAEAALSPPFRSPTASEASVPDTDPVRATLPEGDGEFEPTPAPAPAPTAISTAAPPSVPTAASVMAAAAAPPPSRPAIAAEPASPPPPRRSRSAAILLPRYIPPMTRGETASHALSGVDEAGESSAPAEPSASPESGEEARAQAAKEGAAGPRERLSEAAPEPDRPSFIEVTPRTLSTEERLQMDFHAAADAYREGALGEAERLLEALLERDRGHHRARLLLARLHEDQGLDERAEEVLSRGLLHYPRHVPYASSYARLLARQGRDRAAIVALGKALPEGHADAESHALLAGLHQRAGDPSAATESYLAALRIKPMVGEWWMGLGLSSEQAGDEKSAAEAYGRALRLRLPEEVERYVQSRLRDLTSGSGAGGARRGEAELDS